MKKVGLTGNIGSGKSTASLIFNAMGVPVFNADSEAKKLYSEEYVKIKINELFGNAVFTEDGSVDFKKLANIIFNDKKALQQVNALIHPLTLKNYKTWLEKNKGAAYTIHEAAIIFENKLQHHFDLVITVSAPEETRLERIMKRDNLKPKIIRERIKNQLPENEKCQLSDFIIVNDGKEMLIPQILKINNLILNK
ncbi:MAG TPA: dephospho-CoA kinase [Bacteroidales bacterium]